MSEKQNKKEKLLQLLDDSDRVYLGEEFTQKVMDEIRSQKKTKPLSAYARILLPLAGCAAAIVLLIRLPLRNGNFTAESADLSQNEIITLETEAQTEGFSLSPEESEPQPELFSPSTEESEQNSVGEIVYSAEEENREELAEAESIPQQDETPLSEESSHDEPQSAESEPNQEPETVPPEPDIRTEQRTEPEITPQVKNDEPETVMAEEEKPMQPVEKEPEESIPEAVEIITQEIVTDNREEVRKEPDTVPQTDTVKAEETEPFPPQETKSGNTAETKNIPSEPDVRINTAKIDSVPETGFLFSQIKPDGEPIVSFIIQVPAAQTGALNSLLALPDSEEQSMTVYAFPKDGTEEEFENCLTEAAKKLNLSAPCKRAENPDGTFYELTIVTE